MSAIAGRLIASAGSGLAAGAAGMYLWDRGTGGSVEEIQTEAAGASTPRSVALPAEGPSVASDFVMPFVKRYGLPDLDQVILPNEEYTSCWDARTRNVRWVVERINLDTVSGSADRKRAYFRPDSRLQPLFRSNLSDYSGSGFDRGHLAPAGDHKTTQKNLTETFLLTNMAPQSPSFNRGYWADFEEFVRSLVEPDSSTTPVPFKDVFVITGPLFLPSKEEDPAAPGSADGGAVDADGQAVVEVPASSSSDKAKWVVKHDIIGNPMQMVGVPTHFFKVIVAEPFPSSSSQSADGSDDSPMTYVAAFAMPNTSIPNNTDLRNFLVPFDVLESVAGMRFLGAALGTGVLDNNAKVSLDKEALQVRAKAGIPALPAHWAEGKVNGYRLLTESADSVGASETQRIFRHLCTTTSCVGL